MKKPLYYVQAYRWGKIDNHSYVVGVWDNSTEAQSAAVMEESYRGGKYECVVYLCELNQPLEPWTDETPDEL